MLNKVVYKTVSIALNFQNFFKTIFKIIILLKLKYCIYLNTVLGIVFYELSSLILCWIYKVIFFSAFQVDKDGPLVNGAAGALGTALFCFTSVWLMPLQACRKQDESVS